MLVQALVSKPAVAALDVGVLIRFTRIDLPQGDVPSVCPVEHRLANELRAVVTAHDLR